MTETEMFDDDDRARSWAGGGGWQDDPSPPADPPPPPAPPKPKAKRKAEMKPYREKAGRGLVAGRFNPLHRGHEYLVETARRSCSELDVVVFSSPSDVIPASMRMRWLKEAFPSVSVYEVTDPTHFRPAIEKATGHLDYELFFSGEMTAGAVAAKAIGATFVPIDPQRTAFPITGTTIRNDVMKNFGDLAVVTRPCFVRRVSVIGPESTGKTELCKRLAQIYTTRWVPEPARALAEHRGGKLEPEDIEHWARTQMASEDAVAYHARRVMFCDTDPDTVTRWSMRLFDTYPHELSHVKDARPYDLYLICVDDVPYVGRPENDDPVGRREMFALCKKYERRGGVLLTGGFEQRLLTARRAVDQLLTNKGLFSERGKAIASGEIPG